MKKIFLIFVIFLASSTYVGAQQKCNDLPGFKKMGKDSLEYIKCIKDKTKVKLNTDSKLTDLIAGKEKFKLPNPMNGLKAIARAIKPSALEK
tara:strand:- start:455 stop:730 length:276 start_codon:yes stop_codon:yes gene_type:complete